MTRRIRRSGISLIVVLVAMMLVTLLLSSMLRQMVLMQRQVRGRSYSAQAGWLAESALERAARRLREDPTYRGETWTVEHARMTGVGRVEIQVVTRPTGGGRIQAVASYPVGKTITARSRREAPIEVTNQANPEEAN